MAKSKVVAKPVKAVKSTKPAAEEVEAEPKTVQEGDLNRRIKPSYRWIAADVVREAGPDGAETVDLISSCHQSAKAAGLDAKDDAYWGRRLTRARALLRKAGLGTFKVQRQLIEQAEKPVKAAKAKKAKKQSDEGVYEDA